MYKRFAEGYEGVDKKLDGSWVSSVIVGKVGSECLYGCLYGGGNDCWMNGILCFI